MESWKGKWLEVLSLEWSCERDWMYNFDAGQWWRTESLWRRLMEHWDWIWMESLKDGTVECWTVGQTAQGVGKKTDVLQCHVGEKTENSRPSTRYNIHVIVWNVDCGEGKQSQMERGRELILRREGDTALTGGSRKPKNLAQSDKMSYENLKRWQKVRMVRGWWARDLKKWEARVNSGGSVGERFITKVAKCYNMDGCMERGWLLIVEVWKISESGSWEI